MLREFSLYDLFILSFVQLVLATVLVLSPAREIGTRVRWTGSKITEVLLGASARSRSPPSRALSPPSFGVCPPPGLETAAYSWSHPLGGRHRLPPRLWRRRPGLLRLVCRGGIHLHRLCGVRRRAAHAARSPRR